METVVYSVNVNRLTSAPGSSAEMALLTEDFSLSGVWSGEDWLIAPQ